MAKSHDGHRQYVFEFGRAEAADDTVVVHGGWGAEHGYLVHPLLPLTDRYRFVLYDQRGSLRSPSPDSVEGDRWVGVTLHVGGRTLSGSRTR